MSTDFSWTWNENRKKPQAQAESASGSKRFEGCRKRSTHGGVMAARVAIRL